MTDPASHAPGPQASAPGAAQSEWAGALSGVRTSLHEGPDISMIKVEISGDAPVVLTMFNPDRASLIWQAEQIDFAVAAAREDTDLSPDRVFEGYLVLDQAQRLFRFAAVSLQGQETPAAIAKAAALIDLAGRLQARLARDCPPRVVASLGVQVPARPS